VACFLALAASEGGFLPIAWYPAALFLAALLVLALLTVPLGARPPRAVLAAVLLLAAYAVWTYVSITWADNQGEAWDGANRTLAYAVVFTLFALWPIGGRAATIVLGAFGLGVAALGLFVLVRASGAADALQYFVGGRFVDPVGYPNGNVALWFSGLLPCVFIAGRREVPAAVRGVALGGAGLLAGLALLGQSRGWLFTLPLTLILFLAVAPGRARNAIALLATAGAAVVAAGPVLEVFRGVQGEAAAEPLIAAAARTILLGSAALAVVGTVVAYIDRAVAVSRDTARRTSFAVMACVVAAACGAVAVVWATYGSPVARASTAWEQFKSNEAPAGGTSRFSSALGQNRYDFWSVAWSEFADAPVTGVGVDNFQQDYLARGRSTERPRYPHSLEMRVIAQTGVVGALLLAGGLAAAAFAALRGAKARRGLHGAAAGASLATFAYWVVHGSGDWFWELPALGASAFAMLGLAVALSPRDALVERVARRPLAHGRARLAAVAVAAAALVLTLAPPWLAYRQIDFALDSWADSPADAFARLDRAARLNPLSSQADATAGAIALRLARPFTAQRRFGAALARNPRSALANLQLGAIASQLGRRDDARRSLERAAALNPRDEITRSALERLRSGKPLDAEALYDQVVRRARAVAGSR